MSNNGGEEERYPKGKLNDYDEGQFHLTVGVDPEFKACVIDFGKDVRWIGLEVAELSEFIKLLQGKLEVLEAHREQPH